MEALTAVDLSPLLTPFDTKRGIALKNRFVMAPMTRRRSPGNVPGQDVAAYYARRASSMGLLITEGTYIDHGSAGDSSEVPTMYGTDALKGWSQVVDAIHDQGGQIWAQLWHIGGTRRPAGPPGRESPVVSPSGIGLAGENCGNPASVGVINDIIAAYARSAVNARDVGFDGIELHGAHGYLIDEFLWAFTNRRTDGYGGSPQGRNRFASEVVSAVRAAVGDEFPIGFRFSQWKDGQYDARIADAPQELQDLLTPVVDAGVDLLHPSTRRYWQPAFAGSDRTLAGWTKQLFDVPVIALGSVGVSSPFAGTGKDEARQATDLTPLVDLFHRGEFDLVGLGRASLADPDWVRKVADGRFGEVRAYTKAMEKTLH
ncbi:NADH:flavin oxidoreductase [Rhodococcus sp. 14C212]|uniref:NADH:flavin oxidoreductase n=1 Tax=Rhodococcus sp. 14C212 TaxID=2711209 RepID=UPI0013ECE78E|nr:NADH:flavin oxidoreductase [Rhodococcus sp. 14C212]NGP06744.1 NADH:flavin oxidoreductase [Rhodococcus sp. 14C212]